jgi:carbon starvation protein
MLAVGVVGGGFTGVTTVAPAFNLATGELKLGYIWPFLFITVACGAISGFHALVAGGTVSKQASKESHARVIGYGGMILEGVLAVCVLLTVASGLDFNTYMSIVWPAKGGANPVLAFSLSMGGMLNKALGLPMAFGTVFGILMVEGFVITTLDTAVRLNRYLFEELWAILFENPPAFLKSYYFNAALSCVLMLWLAYTNTFQLIWPIFGASNQLLAALTLVGVSVWLTVRGKPTWFTLLPAVFMMVTTVTGLVLLFFKTYLPKGNVPLMVADVLLVLLAVGVAVLGIRKISELRKGPAAPSESPPAISNVGLTKSTRSPPPPSTGAARQLPAWPCDRSPHPLEKRTWRSRSRPKPSRSSGRAARPCTSSRPRSSPPPAARSRSRIGPRSDSARRRRARTACSSSSRWTRSRCTCPPRSARSGAR